MLCAIYKSSKKEQTYLYITKRDDFSSVPEALLTNFGTPIFVMLVNLAQRQKLALADINKVKQALIEQGYFLQLPPPKENWLAEHKQQGGFNE